MQYKIKNMILMSLLCVTLSCVSPGAVQTEIQGIKNEMGQLKKVADQLSIWKKNINAEQISYGGAGWVVVGSILMAAIFLGFGFLLIKAFMNRGKSLHLLTCAVKKVGKVDPSAVNKIKYYLKEEVLTGKFKESDRQNIGNFAMKKGTFVKHNLASDVQ